MNKDEICLICEKLPLKSIIYFTSTCKKFFHIRQIWINKMKEYPDYKMYLFENGNEKDIYISLWRIKRLKTKLNLEAHPYIIYNTKSFCTSHYLKEVPKDVIVLKNLERLCLDNNEISKIPIDLQVLKNLKVLSLSNNNLNFFPDIFNMINLEEVYISENNIRYIPKKIGKLKNLIRLNVSRNRLTELPQELFQLKNLQGLYIQGNRIPKIESSNIFILS